MVSYLKNMVRSVLPAEVVLAARQAIRYGGIGCYCPVCGGHFRKFETYTYDPTIPDPTCPKCRSLRRTRLLWMYLKNKTNLFRDRLSVLHVAPERDIQNGLKKMANLDYLSVDLMSAQAMQKMDICHIEKPDKTYDVILCNHVLEHIPDDGRAMRELYRVLKPGGWAILQVPMLEQERTYEDASIVTPEERTKAFGQWDHVRYYGQDYRDRLQASGFKCRSIRTCRAWGRT